MGEQTKRRKGMSINVGGGELNLLLGIKTKNTLVLGVGMELEVMQ